MCHTASHIMFVVQCMGCALHTSGACCRTCIIGITARRSLLCQRSALKHSTRYTVVLSDLCLLRATGSMLLLQMRCFRSILTFCRWSGEKQVHSMQDTKLFLVCAMCWNFP